jgi:hypothetical protein
LGKNRELDPSKLAGKEGFFSHGAAGLTCRMYGEAVRGNQASRGGLVPDF